MLNRLPKWTGEWADLLADIGNPKPAQIAKALGVSKRTVERWNSTKPPRMAMLSLRWLSRHAHSEWDAEMHNRTQMAVTTNKGLWRDVRDLREQVLIARTQKLTNQWRGPAKNDDPQPTPDATAYRPHWGKPQPPGRLRK